jgi:sugar lactone lactonase YvrE
MLFHKLIGASAPTVKEWDIGFATFTRAFSVATNASAPEDLFFNPDGTKMFIVTIGADVVAEYALGTAWNISTATFTASYSVGTQDGLPRGLTFKPDGTKFYIAGDQNNRVYEYNLSTAWSISTASYVQSFDVVVNDDLPHALQFKPDGINMYLVGRRYGAVYRYNIGTPWSVATATSVETANAISGRNGLFFKADGSKMYTCEGGSVYQYTLPTPWVLAGASFIKSFNISANDTLNSGLFFSPDGSRMYTCGTQNNSVYEYAIG